MTKTCRWEWTVDRFVQELKRPYGSVWREAILVHLEKQELVKLLNQHRRYVVNYHHVRSKVVGAIIGILTMGSLLFGGVNFWTKGYHRGKLAFVILVVATVSIWVICLTIAEEIFV